MFDTEIVKQVLVSSKKSFYCYSSKIQLPREEDLLEICQLKDFERDFREQNAALGSKEIAVHQMESEL